MSAWARSLVAALACLCAACGNRTAPAPQHLSIAAAADLRFALDQVTSAFRRANPQIDVAVAYGSSGNFYSQLRNKAPFDVYLSADVEYPRKLAAEGLTAPQSEFVYGVGRIVLWVQNQSPLDVAKLQMHALEAPSVRHIAIANPQHAPYGRAAEAAMRSLGVYDAVQSKLVLGEDIAQTLQFVQSGAADAGIVALSLVLAPPLHSQGRYWEIPLDAYPTIEQGGAIMAAAKDKKFAWDFRAYLMGAEGRRILKQYGFYLPGR
ncbi:MAG TPA: molybdate ABC transporter substrate-binding protein [Bryobacteraceae bacterium]|nr:molybdate ABC transporter substrate-binding protein [Bryobacteraceae bacterium]